MFEIIECLKINNYMHVYENESLLSDDEKLSNRSSIPPISTKQKKV
jgi:hypothetical protein